MRGSLVLVVAIVAFATIACRNTPAQSNEAAEPVAVNVEVARPQTLRATVSGPGTVTVAPGADWTIFPEETGRIVELPKAEGDAVSRGDVLVRFDYGDAAAEISTREIGLSAANAALDEAKRRFARVSAMNDRGYTSRSDFDSAKAEIASAELGVARAKELLEAARTAGDRATIKARFSGVVAKRFHVEGDLVNASTGDPVLRVVDPSRAQVAMNVSLQDLVQLQRGQPATIVSAQGAEVGTIAIRPTPTDSRAATQEIRIAFANPTSLPLDSTVQVEILLSERPGVISVPSAALLRADDGKTFVMIAGVDGRAHRRDVRAGMTTHDRVEITAGVTTGDRVIVKNPSAIPEGQIIVVDK
jgi:RND family efflux transporter MFP subunit